MAAPKSRQAILNDLRRRRNAGGGLNGGSDNGFGDEVGGSGVGGSTIAAATSKDSASAVASAAVTTLTTAPLLSGGLPDASSYWKLRFVLAGVALFALMLHVNTLSAGFTYDDRRAILENEDVRNNTPWAPLLTNDYWGRSMGDERSHKSYRPLTVATFKLNALLHGYNPAGFHVVNVILHALVCVIFTFLAAEALRSTTAGAAVGAMFTAHAVHTEAVASIVGRAELLSGLLFCAALLSYTRAPAARNSNSKEQQQQTGGGSSISSSRNYATHRMPMFLYVVFTGLAMLAKEQGITVVAVATLWDLVVHCQLAPSQWFVALFSRSDSSSSSTNNSNGLRYRVTVSAGIGILLVSIRLALMGGTQPIFLAKELPHRLHTDSMVRVLSCNYLLVHNAILLFFPNTLCSDWSYASIPLISSLKDSRNLATLALYSLLFFRAWALWGKNSSNSLGIRAEILGWGILVLTFLPATGLFFTVGFVVAERVLYLPSMGACFLAFSVMSRLYHARRSSSSSSSTSSGPPRGSNGSSSRRAGRSGRAGRTCRFLAQAAFIGTVALLAARTVTRNEDWHSDFTLNSAGIAVNPDNVKLLNNLALLHENEARDTDRPEQKRVTAVKEALALYGRALDLDNNSATTHYQIGNLYSDLLNRTDSAIEHYEKAVAQKDQTITGVMAHTNLATLYFRSQMFEDARTQFAAALDTMPEHPQALNGMASLLGTERRHAEAEELFQRALVARPGYVEAQFNLGTLYAHWGRYEDAITHLNRVLELYPSHKGAETNLIYVRHQQKQLEKERTTAEESGDESSQVEEEENMKREEEEEEGEIEEEKKEGEERGGE